MDYIAHLDKLRRFRESLPKDTNLIQRVITNKDNTPFLSIGDLVAFHPEHSLNLDLDCIYLFIMKDFEKIGFVDHNHSKIKNLLKIENIPLSAAESIHRLCLVSKF